jgi:site-specific DNA-methyltransferase (adenine-specific)
MQKVKAEKNRTISLESKEIEILLQKSEILNSKAELNVIQNRIIFQDFYSATKYLPTNFVDLLILDPPYNMYKKFNTNSFAQKTVDDYSEYLDKIIANIIPTLKETASIYVCGDWKSSISIPFVLAKYFKIRNRITWEREKGRGAMTNWKNNSEDIWFATVSDNFYFNSEAVKLKRKVLAPYKNENGEPKDWQKSKSGDFRLTFPSNLWTDISIPFWSMPENTNHPTQKPEKLIAKLVLASSNQGDFIFDPFLGSGTSAVVAKKLNRKYLGIESDKEFVALSQKRLEIADTNSEIQGYSENVFWERNSFNYKNKKKKNDHLEEING